MDEDSKIDKLKAVLILGINQQQEYLDLAGIYNQKGYLIIGDGVNPLSNKNLYELRGRLDHDTRIDILAHGNSNSNKHFISLQNSPEETRLIFNKLKILSAGSALHVHLWSCYGGVAAKDVIYLTEGSVLITHSAEDEISLAWESIQLNKIIDRIKNNFTVSPFQSLLENSYFYYSNPFTVSSVIKGHAYSLYLAPNLLRLFKQPKEELNNIAAEINSYYKSLFERIEVNDYAYFKQNDLIFPIFNSEDEEKVMQLNLIYNCIIGNFPDLHEIFDDEAYKEFLTGAINTSVGRINALQDSSFGEFCKEIVRLLLNHGADSKITTHKNITALHVAARRGHLDIAKLLIMNGAKVNSIDENNTTPLILAASEGNTVLVRLLLNYDADPNIFSHGSTAPLHIAAHKGYFHISKLLLKHGAEVNFADGNGFTPLVVACFIGQPGIVKLLLDYRADPNIVNHNNVSALYAAVKGGHSGIAELLLNHDADPNIITNDNSTALYMAAQEGSRYMVDLLLKHGADVNFSDENNITPLFRALLNNHTSIANLLLNHGADPNAVRNDNVSPLYLAIHQGYKDTAELLIKHGAEVNFFDELGVTPLHIAVTKKHYGIIEMMLKYHAAPQAYDSQGRTPYMLAKILGENKIAKMLEQAIKQTTGKERVIEKVTKDFAVTYLAVHSNNGVYLNSDCGDDVPIFSYKNFSYEEFFICESRNYHDEL